MGKGFSLSGDPQESQPAVQDIECSIWKWPSKRLSASDTLARRRQHQECSASAHSSSGSTAGWELKMDRRSRSVNSAEPSGVTFSWTRPVPHLLYR